MNTSLAISLLAISVGSLLASYLLSTDPVYDKDADTTIGKLVGFADLGISCRELKIQRDIVGKPEALIENENDGYLPVFEIEDGTEVIKIIGEDLCNHLDSEDIGSNFELMYLRDDEFKISSVIMSENRENHNQNLLIARRTTRFIGAVAFVCACFVWLV